MRGCEASEHNGGPILTEVRSVSHWPCLRSEVDKKSREKSSGSREG